MQVVNILPFEVNQLIDMTKPKSYAYGRRLYRFKQYEKHYWLKIQLRDTHTLFEHSYCQELMFYQNMQNLAYLLPCQQLDVSHCVEFKTSYKALILPHAMPWLSIATHLSIQQIAKKILAMLLSIEHFYHLGYLHADLKHEHFVMWQGQLKLLDFEQVQSIDNPPAQLTATPRYMAPELFHGQPKTLYTELYALGIILYEWLAGQRLTAKSYLDWAYLHCQQLELRLDAPYAVFLPVLQALTRKQITAREQDYGMLKQYLQRLID